MSKLRRSSVLSYTAILAALAAAALAILGEPWLAAAAALAAASLCAASSRSFARAGLEASREASLLRARLEAALGENDERRGASLELGSELEASAARTVSLLHRLEGLASGTSDGIKVLGECLASAAETYESALEAQGRVRAALSSYSSEVLAESLAVKDMVGAVEKLSSWSREKGEVARSLLERAAEAEAKLLEIGKASERMVAAARNSAAFNGVIADLAERTNLLALNASVEAAHAGSAGRGFAVVAAQVRSLSEESKKNSQSVSSAIDGTLRSIGDTADAAAEASDYFRSVVAEMREISASFETILAELAALSSGSARIDASLEAVGRLNAESEAALGRSEESMGRSKDSLGVVQDIASDIGRDSASMMSAFKENLAEAERTKVLGLKASSPSDPA